MTDTNKDLLNQEPSPGVEEKSRWAEGLKKNLIPIAIVVAGLLVAGVFYFTQNSGGITQTLAPAQAAQRALDYINHNLLQDQNATATVSQITEQNGVYRLQLKVDSQVFDTYVTRDGKLLFIQGIDLSQESENATTGQTGRTIGSFSVSPDEICQEDGKPIVYFFGSESCPHCRWEHPIFQQVAANFKDYVSFHDNMDSEDDMDVFGKYSTGGIPTIVLGCKYYRLGSGENYGEDQESQYLTALFCKLTGEQPDAVCSPVKDLTDQINS